MNRLVKKPCIGDKPTFFAMIPNEKETAKYPIPTGLVGWEHSGHARRAHPCMGATAAGRRLHGHAGRGSRGSLEPNAPPSGLTGRAHDGHRPGARRRRNAFSPMV